MSSVLGSSKWPFKGEVKTMKMSRLDNIKCNYLEPEENDTRGTVMMACKPNSRIQYRVWIEAGKF